MAAEMGISEATVRRIWHAHGLKPHLLERLFFRNQFLLKPIHCRHQNGATVSS
jgi:hypothetical protein